MPMTYPGNPSLSADARQRILGTFQQTLDLAAQGSRQEALLGCDFVLRMDPNFEPARRLLDRLKSASGAVRVDDLTDAAAGLPGDDLLPSLDGLDSLGSLDSLESLGFLEPLEELPLEDDLPASFSGNGGDPGSLHATLSGLFETRRFQDFLTLAQANQAAVAADPELRTLAATAQERLEAEPYVGRFLAKAREVLSAGQRDEVGRLLDKARSLDPTHPGIAEIEKLAAAPPPAPPRAAQELPAALRPSSTPPLDLFSEGSGDSESDRRIAQLLAEGQSAFDAGDPQAAIDAWSRIFLIDIDHQEAARHIEQARKLKAENERQVEEIFHDGLNSLESGNLPGARRAFEQVLALQPSYLAAREYLQQIDDGIVPVLAPRPGGREPMGSPLAPIAPMSAMSAMPPSGPGTGAGLLSDLPDAGDLKEEILVPPEPGEAPARGERREPRRAAVRQGRASRRFLYIGGAVLAAVLLAGLGLYWKWDSIFPNLPADHLATPAPAPAASPVTRAVTLHNQGKTVNALALLKRLPPGDPHYAEAQKLIAQWEAGAPGATGGGIAASGTEPLAPGVPGAPGAISAPVGALPTEAAAHRQELIEAGRKAYAKGDYLHASEQFDQAAVIARLDPPEAEQLAQAKRRLQPLAEQVKLFKQHDWEFILPTLWKMRESNPDDHNVDRLIVDSYYNLGIRDLQRADPVHAATQFAEALKLEPGDATLRRHYLFAQTYQERPQDLLFRIYVKYLPYR
jgi:tetratricopeptide (TPR) repeat protein